MSSLRSDFFVLKKGRLILLNKRREFLSQVDVANTTIEFIAKSCFMHSESETSHLRLEIA